MGSLDRSQGYGEGAESGGVSVGGRTRRGRRPPHLRARPHVVHPVHEGVHAGVGAREQEQPLLDAQIHCLSRQLVQPEPVINSVEVMYFRLSSYIDKRGSVDFGG